MIELAIVVAIIAILGAIAVPRFGLLVERAKAKRMVLDIGRLQTAVDLYTEEHGGQNPAMGPGNTVGTPAEMLARLTGQTDPDGTANASGLFGPYVHKLPDNAVSGKSGLRIDGVAAGANTHGWRFDSATGVIEPDHDGNIVLDGGAINFARVGVGVADALDAGAGKGVGGSLGKDLGG